MSGAGSGALVFALDSVPDVAALRRLNRLPAELSDAEVAEFAFQRQRAANAADDLPGYLQQLAAYACCWLDEQGFQLRSAAGPDEPALLQSLFAHLGQGRQLLRWSEREASVEGLRWRALQGCVVAGPAWAALDGCGFILEAQQAPAPAVSALALLAGLPSLREPSGESRWQAALAQDWVSLREGAELRALTSWLLQQRKELVAGTISRELFERQQASLRDWLADASAPYLRDFAAAWRS